MTFVPPLASKNQVEGVPFGKAVNFAAAAKHAFDTKDKEPGNRDPSLCKALLAFEVNGRPEAVFWSAKMAIDTDGPALGPGHLSGKQLDPGSGQDHTTLHFANGKSLPAEGVSYIVLPQLKPHSNETFDPAVAIGDVAVVIFKDKLTTAICADLGPFNKIGEASIHVHEQLQQAGCPDPCPTRDAHGICKSVRNSSVEKDVLYFVFPGSAFGQHELDLDTINDMVKKRALDLYGKLRKAA